MAYVSKSSLPPLINPFLAQAGCGGGGPKIEPTDDKWADLGAGAGRLLMGKKVISARQSCLLANFYPFCLDRLLFTGQGGRSRI